MFDALMTRAEHVAKKVAAMVTLLAAGASSMLFTMPQMAYAEQAGDIVEINSSSDFF